MTIDDASSEAPPATESVSGLLDKAGDLLRDVRPVAETGMRFAVVIAFLIHAFLLFVAAGGLDRLLPASLISSPDKKPPPIGDEKGQLDGVAAEVIDAKEFDKRFISFNAGRDAADSEAAQKTPQQQPQEEQKQKAEAEQKPETPGEVAPPSPKQAKPEPKKPDQTLTEADIKELLASTMNDIEDGVVAVSKAGAARLGQASPYVRQVVRILKSSMPKRVGIRGTVVVRFLVGDTGDVIAIAVVQSSGKPELDRIVVENIRKTHLVVPGRDVSERERQFQISYEYN
ncbi:MAG: energy transducer TonB [Proteobacteria bacterium]|nr:energy transducer TonB [Pseudomonadota bacterium]